MHTLLLLGGYGETGRALAPLLLQHTNVRLVLAGRTPERATTRAAELNAQFPGERVQARSADAADYASMMAALVGVDTLVITASTTRHASVTARAALASQVDCIDIQYSPAKVALLRSLAPDIERAGCCFVTDAGFHPGLPGVLVRRAARDLDVIESAHVGSVIRADWRSVDTGDDAVIELVDMLHDYDVAALTNGVWSHYGLFSRAALRTFDMPAPFGRQQCFAMGLQEMHELTDDYPALRDGGFFVGGFRPLVDWLVLPLIFAVQRFAPGRKRLAARLLRAALRAGSRPPFGTMLLLRASGMRADKRAYVYLTVAHPSGYFLTAAAVAAGLLQLLEGPARRPGLWTQARIVDPVRMLEDLARLGVAVRTGSAELPRA